MFKKSLVTIAALGAFAGSAFAGVTLYGAVDGGFEYSYDKANGVGKDSHSAFKLADGIGTPNQFGIKGEEKISDDLAVGFKLENGFHIANGAMGTNGVLFDREAILYAKTVAGTVAVGREGAISSGFGMFGQFGGKVAAYGNGRGSVPGLKWVLGSTTNRYDQSLTFESPKFAGVKVLAQFANKGTQAGHGYFDNEKNDLFYALGATFENEQAYGTALVDVLDKHEDGAKNGVKVSLGGNVKFDGVQVFAAGQYFKNVTLNVDTIENASNYPNAAKPANTVEMKGFGLNGGVAVPFATGSLKGNVGYMHAKVAQDSSIKMNRFTVGAVYDYPLSKRTFIYTGVGAAFDKYKGVEGNDPTSARAFAANLGLSHKF